VIFTARRMTVLLLYEERHAKIKYVSINTRHYTSKRIGFLR
jgi:hypothetical protein